MTTLNVKNKKRAAVMLRTLYGGLRSLAFKDLDISVMELIFAEIGSETEVVKEKAVKLFDSTKEFTEVWSRLGQGKRSFGFFFTDIRGCIRLTDRGEDVIEMLQMANVREEAELLAASHKMADRKKRVAEAALIPLKKQKPVKEKKSFEKVTGFDDLKGKFKKH